MPDHKIAYYKIVRYGVSMDRKYKTLKDAEATRRLLTPTACVIRGYNAAGKVVSDF